MYEGILLYGEIAVKHGLKEGSVVKPEQYVHLMLENAAYGMAYSRLKLQEQGDDTSH